MMRVNAYSFARMIKMLVDGPQTVSEIVEDTGLHRVTVSRYLRELHRAKAVGICAWEPDAKGRDAIKVYELGRTGRDAKRAKMTQAQRQEAYRARKREKAVHQMLAGGGP